MVGLTGLRDLLALTVVAVQNSVEGSLLLYFSARIAASSKLVKTPFFIFFCFDPCHLLYLCMSSDAELMCVCVCVCVCERERVCG